MMNDEDETLIPGGEDGSTTNNSNNRRPPRLSTTNSNSNQNQSGLSAFARNSTKKSRNIHNMSSPRTTSSGLSGGFRNPRETFQNIAATAAGTLDRNNLNSSSSPRESAPAVVFGATVSDRETNMASLRLRRMTAFESHDYDPIDCDIEEEQLRLSLIHI